jgi:hypothetical protein
MKPVIVHLKLPDDLSAKARELAGKRPVRDVILEALREQWMPKLSDDERDDREEQEMRGMADSYPTYGSIPSEQKRA